MIKCARVIAHVYKRDFAHALSCTSVTYVHAPVAHGRMGVQGVCLCQCAPGRSEPAVSHLLLMKRTSAVTRDRTFWQPHIRCERLLSVGRPRVRGAAVQAGAQLTGRPEQIQPSLLPPKMHSRMAGTLPRPSPSGDGKRHGSVRHPPQCPVPAAVASRAQSTVLWVPHGGCSCGVRRPGSFAQGIVFAGAAWRHRSMRHAPEGRRRGGLATRLHGGAAATCEVLPPPLSPPNPARHPSACWGKQCSGAACVGITNEHGLGAQVADADTRAALTPECQASQPALPSSLPRRRLLATARQRRPH